MESENRFALSHSRVIRLSASLETFVLGCACALVVAEGMIAMGLGVPGLVLDAGVVIALVNAFELDRRYRDRSEHQHAALLALLLVPLLRIATESLASPETQPAYRLALVGLPVLVAVEFVLRAASLPRPSVAWRSLRETAVAALVGVLLGLIAYGILRPPPLLSSPSLQEILVASLVVGAFAVLEELIFRGLLQQSLGALFPRAGLIVVNMLFVSMYLGTKSAPFLLLLAACGIAASIVARRTGSLLGVMTAHGLASIGALLIWPLLLG